ncbi:MAG TPA: NAD-dependent epimerase/dehydratase family protein, partial [Candidatus Kapabacteria bacterium]|nr:NAD-dependent epimerase/dehydratase family protein [Candidatus Kapabacteria bacterium]
MKALVTGATGFIGSHLAEHLLAKGYEVRCLVRKTATPRWLEGKPFELVYGGLSDMESLAAAVKGVDCIYHVAGLTAAKSREEFFKGNRDAT